jgi:hypothetical protein
VAAAPAVRAQRGTSRLEGEIVDSIAAKPIVGALVFVTRVAPEPPQYLIATTDARGRFRFDTLEAGRYEVSFSSPFLESIGLTLPPRQITLAAGERARVDLASPSSATLRAAACLGLRLPAGRGAVIGRVTDAETEQPLAGAVVAVNWTDLSVDRASLEARMEPRGGNVTADSLGQYRLCGVPTENALLVQVQHDGRVGSALRTSVPEAAGIVALDLSLSRAAARAIVDPAAEDTAAVTPLSGTASLTGVVRGMDGEPIADALVRVVDAAGGVRTDSAGRFSLANLPAGTQMLEVRRIGYLLGQRPVELRGGRSVAQAVELARIVSLDSIRVVARRTRYREFESRARHGRGSGIFLSEDEIEKRNVVETSDLLRAVPGFMVIGTGLDAQVKSTRGTRSILLRCEPNIVIDGMQHQEINLVRPSDIGAIEAYGGPAGAPVQYDSACGVILIWTRR